MGENSKIEWTDHTFNPWIGCQHVSPGCNHCYAEVMMDHRYGRVEWGPHGERKRTSEANWTKSLKWNVEAGELKQSMAIDLVYFVHLSPTCSIIKFLQIGAETCLH
jgi:protein gp37